MSKKTFILALLLALLAGAALHRWLTPATENGPPPLFGEAGEAEGEPSALSEEPAADSVRGVTKPSGDAIDRPAADGPRPEIDSTDAGAEPPESELPARAAIPEDRSGAIDLASRLEGCRFGFFSADKIRRDVDRKAQAGNWGGDRIWVIQGEARQFDNLAEYEAYLWARHDDCQAFGEIADADFRRILLAEANAGNVFARYLYAMWPPEEAAANTAAMLEYQERALDFTWRSIEEGEPLGLLALGQSYRQAGTSPLFTPRNTVLGRVFLLAAAGCGIESPVLDREMERILKALVPRPSSPTERLDEIYVVADSIREQFCE
ncbi:MAG: hypothetical protein KJO33_01870 [Gammaproteobacteria bacterium]|nr:hypothetical protein [Gammaproteobacteria bacterium]